MLYFIFSIYKLHISIFLSKFPPIHFDFHPPFAFAFFDILLYHDSSMVRAEFSCPNHKIWKDPVFR